MIDRLKRVEELIKREVSVIVQTKIDDPLVNGITVTRVEVTRDIRLAKIYFETPENDSGNSRKIEKILTTYARFMRGELAREVSLKYIPRLSFREDIDGKKQRQIDEILDRIKEENRRQGTDLNTEKGEKDEF